LFFFSVRLWIDHFNVQGERAKGVSPVQRQHPGGGVFSGGGGRFHIHNEREFSPRRDFLTYIKDIALCLQLGAADVLEVQAAHFPAPGADVLYRPDTIKIPIGLNFCAIRRGYTDQLAGIGTGCGGGAWHRGIGDRGIGDPGVGWRGGQCGGGFWGDGSRGFKGWGKGKGAGGQCHGSAGQLC